MDGNAPVWGGVISRISLTLYASHPSYAVAWEDLDTLLEKLQWPAQR